MKKVFSYCSLFVMLFLLTACPYSAEFALNEPNEKIKNEYLGTWGEESQFENAPYYVITKLTDKTYQFEKNEYSDTDKAYKKTVLTGHFTKLGNVNFLNLKDNSEDKYYFHKVELSADKKQFVIYEVTDNIDEKFSNASDLKAFFDKNKDLSFFYNRDEKKYNKK
jgi:hypothetical protein